MGTCMDTQSPTCVSLRISNVSRTFRSKETVKECTVSFSRYAGVTSMFASFHTSPFDPAPRLYTLSNCSSHAEVEPCGVGEPKFFALNSYASLFFNPVLLPLRHKKNAPAPKTARPPTMAPTAMPAFAPVDSPPPPPEACSGVDDADKSVLEGELPDEPGVGVLKLSDVTLKQGTLMEKLIVSTKVWSQCQW